MCIRDSRMPDLHGLCTGKEHVVADQRFDSVVLLAFGKEHACLMVWLALVHGLVDLIEGCLLYTSVKVMTCSDDKKLRFS